MRKLFRGDLLCSFVAFNTVQSISLLPKNPIYFIYFTQVILLENIYLKSVANILLRHLRNSHEKNL